MNKPIYIKVTALIEVIPDCDLGVNRTVEIAKDAIGVDFNRAGVAASWEFAEIDIKKTVSRR